MRWPCFRKSGGKDGDSGFNLGSSRQYHPAEGAQLERLTTLGRKQAMLAGKRLRDEKVDRIVHSTMPRAAETAGIIRAQLGFQKALETTDTLRECVPGFPKAARKKYGYNDIKKLTSDKAQADRAFKKYFRLPKKDTVEVLVCHGNIIRYLVCKTLRIDLEAWLKMDIQQCGITVIHLKSKGINRHQLISHNDVGHIKKRDRTFL